MEDDYRNGLNAQYAGGPARHRYSNSREYAAAYGHPGGPSASAGQTPLPPLDPQRAGVHPAGVHYDQHPQQRLPPQSMAYGQHYGNYSSHALSQTHYAPSAASYGSANASYLPSQPSQADAASGIDYGAPAHANYQMMRPVPQHHYETEHAANPYSNAQSFEGMPAETSMNAAVPTSLRRAGLAGDDGRADGAGGGPGSDMDGAAKANFIPQKGEDGKYQCPQCQKTYLHAKHLKRHFLRHTGDRPYSCILCGETFSRSDILKRHFQKCSIRRGNPTGATHLSNAQSHLKKGGNKRTSVDAAFAEPPAAAAPPPPSSLSNHSFASHEAQAGLGLAGLPLHQSHDAPRRDSAGLLSRDARGSVDSPAASNRSTFSHPSHASGQSLPSSGGSTPVTMRKSGYPGHGYSADGSQPGMRGYATDLGMMSSARGPEGSNLPPVSYGDWQAYGTGEPSQGGRSYHHGASGHSGPMRPEMNDGRAAYGSGAGGAGGHAQASQQQQQQQHAQASGQQEFVSTLFTARDDPSSSEGQPQWHMPDSSRTKTERLTVLCQLDASDDADARTLRQYLSPDHVEQFYKHYAIFHGHWPFLHLPTLQPSTMYDGLLLAIVCIGAVYSGEAPVHDVRACLRRAKKILVHSNDAWRLSQAADTTEQLQNYPDLTDQLMALTLVDLVSLWHGDDDQRADTIRSAPGYVGLARRLQLFDVAPPGDPDFSILHQPGSVQGVDIGSWDWDAWLRQERRTRLATFLYLLDCPLMIYFNSACSLLPHEIHVPLPADDAAWDAPTAHECAIALGLHGTSAQQGVNVAGSCRRKQPEFYLAFAALQHRGTIAVPRATNAFSKFLLIHAIITQITYAQRQLLVDDSDSMYPSTSTNETVQAAINVLTVALVQWKSQWDRDIPLQYLPGTPRVGFCRDAAPFFWMAKLRLREPPNALLVPWQQRFPQMMDRLKQIKHFVTQDSEGTGVYEPPQGSAIDASYGVADLTLDMKLLFAPLTLDATPPTPTPPLLHPNPLEGELSTTGSETTACSVSSGSSYAWNESYI